MSEKHKKRKEKRRKRNIKRKLLHQRLLSRKERKLEEELYLLRAKQDKIEPIRKNKNDEDTESTLPD
tara:strand:+ start:330 stop:530 length:201 start_codon:yes stop_codon:yes gene_type:complete